MRIRIILIGILLLSFNSLIAEEIDTIWTKLYNSGENYNDSPREMLLDNDGNIWIAGNTRQSDTINRLILLKYNPEGDTLATRIHQLTYSIWDSPILMDVDVSNDLVVCNRITDDDFNEHSMISKFAVTGDKLWTKIYSHASGHSETVNDMLVDALNNIYVCGEVNDQFLTFKYDTNGNFKWDNVYEWETIFSSASDIAIGFSLNAVVTGFAGGDYATLQYTHAGNINWDKQYTDNDEFDSYARAVATDTSYFYVTGQTFSNAIPPDGDMTTLKYSDNGTQIWVKQFNGAPGAWESGYDIAVDHQDNVVAVGTSNATDPNGADFLIIKYDQNGDTLWVRYVGTPWLVETPYQVNVDNNDNIYVLGTGGGNETVLAKYSSDGELLFYEIFGLSTVDFAFADNGYFYMVELIGSIETGNDIVLSKLRAFTEVMPQVGDSNSDGSINVSDAVFIINFVFAGGQTPDPLETGDANCDGEINVSDAVWIINFVFASGFSPGDVDGDGQPDCTIN